MVAAGVELVGSSSNQQTAVKVAFPSSFSNTPVVVANTLQDPSFPPGSIPDTFAVSIIAVTTEAFAAWVWRVDSTGGWGQNLQLGWIASDEKG